MKTGSLVSRRIFLKSLGWSTVGISVFTSGCSVLPVLPHRKEPNPEDAVLWLSLRENGKVEFVCPRSEIGQGITIAMKQIIAEELSIPVAGISLVMPTSNRLLPTKATVGSDSIKEFSPMVAKAAAALATAVKNRAAERLKSNITAVELKNGRATTSSGQSIKFEDLSSPALLLTEEAVEKAVPVSFDEKKPKQYVGLPLAPHQITEIVTAAEPVYADDIRFPDMLYARIIRPPALSGILNNIDDTEAKQVAGFHSLVKDDDLVAVVAKNRGCLDKAYEAVVQDWSIKEVPSDAIKSSLDIDAALTQGALEHEELDDEFAADEPFDIDLKFSVPLAAHASMEPRTAVANFSQAAQRLEIWTGSQDITLVHKLLADQFSLDSEDIVVHGMRVGGGFGGKTFSSVELEAARLAMKLRRPIKVQWTREDEFLTGFHRPPSEHRIRARLDKDGFLDGWWHAFRSGHVIFSSAFMGPLIQSVTSLIPDAGVMRGAMPPYPSVRTRVEFEDVRLPVLTGPWRGLGASPNCWAIETAINALALKKKIDPIAFRLHILGNANPRLVAALKIVAEMAGWDNLSNTKDRAYGVACGIYKDMSYSATISEVSRAENGFRVTKFWSVQDCGTVINPDQVKAQIEGNLVWGIGMAFFENMQIENNALSARNFDTYEWASYSDIPEMAIKLINKENRPTGAGETSIVSATASITNAVTALTGKPILTLPISA
jgi:isoquinoline 1-oxidoreductase subunit beta